MYKIYLNQVFEKDIYIIIANFPLERKVKISLPTRKKKPFFDVWQHSIL